MELIVVVVTAVLCLCCSCATAVPRARLPWERLSVAEPADDVLRFESTTPIDDLWEAFKTEHGRTYGDEEESRRKEIFASNLEKIAIHNFLYSKGLTSFKLGITPFSDMETAEFKNMMNGVRDHDISADSNATTYLSPNVKLELPRTVDWRTKGYVTPVKNQLACGSCWSFSTTGSLEGQHFRKTGKLVSLSEQNLVDCTRSYGNLGCSGGYVDRSFNYIKANGGIDTEASYPYTGRDGTCHYNPSTRGATVTRHVVLPTGSESKLQEAVANIGPISVYIDASHPSFQQYKSGVYNEPHCSSTNYDHAVLVVGYGTENGRDYWLVKNSWSTGWGENGYIKMSRNKNNQCGIATVPIYPLV